MEKRVKLVPKRLGGYVLVPIDDIFVRSKKQNIVICRKITQEDYGFWIYKNTIVGGSSIDGIGDHVNVEVFTDEHAKTIMDNDCICWVEVDYEEVLKYPSNGLGHRKVVIHLEETVYEPIPEVIEKPNGGHIHVDLDI